VEPSALAGGRAAYQQKAWADARRLLAEADGAAPLPVADLERLALATELAGDTADALRLMERLYQALLDQGRPLRAARIAFWIGFRLGALGEAARGSGWYGRSQRLVDAHDQPCAERGYLMVPAGRRQLIAGDVEAAARIAAEAVAIGEREGEADLTAMARCLLGRVLVAQGRVEDALVLMDEVMVASSAGELSPLVTCLTYCLVISSCQQVYAVDRAREWTALLAPWWDEQPQLVTFVGSCLVHRAEILELGGAWGEAALAARRASERCPPAVDPEATGQAHYQRAEIHRLRGERAAAEEAYGAASQLGCEPQPGLALLRLQEGNTEAAAGAIRRVLGATSNRWRRVRLLPAFVEVLLAAGALDEARAASDELAQIAGELNTEVIGAIAAHARGAVLLAQGDAQAALAPLEQAFRVWHKVGAPYLAARPRVLLARACLALGDADGARLALAAAREVFQRLGAAPDLAAIDDLAAALDPAKGAGPHRLTPRELQVLRLVASGKTNRAIAVELSLSEKTIDRHVSNIFNKIDVPTRAAATAYAYEHHLV
jgi:DNA-binding CsgD family transcriptional regulator